MYVVARGPGEKDTGRKVILKWNRGCHCLYNRRLKAYDVICLSKRFGKSFRDKLMTLQFEHCKLLTHPIMATPMLQLAAATSIGAVIQQESSELCSAKARNPLRFTTLSLPSYPFVEPVSGHSNVGVPGGSFRLVVAADGCSVWFTGLNFTDPSD